MFTTKSGSKLQTWAIFRIFAFPRSFHKRTLSYGAYVSISPIDDRIIGFFVTNF